MRQRQGEQREDNGKHRTDVELHVAQFEAREADAPHCHDKADGAPDTNRWEIRHNIQTGGFQSVVGNRVD